jgi:hypothetical protein
MCDIEVDRAKAKSEDGALADRLRGCGGVDWLDCQPPMKAARVSDTAFSSLFQGNSSGLPLTTWRNKMVSTKTEANTVPRPPPRQAMITGKI